MSTLRLPGKSKVRAVILAGLCAIGLAFSADAETLEFDGWIEAVNQADVYSRVEGIVAEVTVSQGEYVEAGAELVRLQQDISRLSLLVAEAKLAQSKALLQKARGRLARIERLSTSGTASDVTLDEARTELLLAEAETKSNTAELELVRTALNDTVIRAPISGYVEDPRVRVGALLEFSSGDPPLFQLVDIDPLRVVYEVPFSVRLTQMDRSGAGNEKEFLKSVRLQIRSTEGQVLGTDIVPEATAVWVDPETNTIRVWATIANDDGILRPGMQVRVLSEVVSSGNALD